MPDARKISTLAVGTLLLMVTACGRSAARSDPGVATARTATAATARPSVSSAAQRPLIRPDVSADESRTLYNAYYQCLSDHGVELSGSRDPKYLGKPTVDLTNPQYRPAADACAAKEPETWMDVETRTDPQYRDRQRAQLQCIKDKGIKAELQGDPPMISFTDDRQISQALAVTGDCEKQVFHDVIDKFKAR